MPPTLSPVCHPVSRPPSPPASVTPSSLALFHAAFSRSSDLASSLVHSKQKLALVIIAEHTHVACNNLLVASGCFWAAVIPASPTVLVWTMASAFIRAVMRESRTRTPPELLAECTHSRKFAGQRQNTAGSTGATTRRLLCNAKGSLTGHKVVCARRCTETSQQVSHLTTPQVSESVAHHGLSLPFIEHRSNSVISSDSTTAPSSSARASAHTYNQQTFAVFVRIYASGMDTPARALRGARPPARAARHLQHGPGANQDSIRQKHSKG